MCVRLCDGYYFPVSFKASSGSFAADEDKCQSSCNAPTKLFYYANPGEHIEDMRDLQGNSYKDLKNAFRYRKEYDAACRCKPDPWCREARNRHQEYARQVHIQSARMADARMISGDDLGDDVRQDSQDHDDGDLIVRRNAANAANYDASGVTAKADARRARRRVIFRRRVSMRRPASQQRSFSDLW